jgi:ribosomal protein S27AE
MFIAQGFTQVLARLRATCVIAECGHIALLKECPKCGLFMAINIRFLRDRASVCEAVS